MEKFCLCIMSTYVCNFRNFHISSLSLLLVSQSHIHCQFKLQAKNPLLSLRKANLFPCKMGNEDDENNIWTNPCTQFVSNRILLSFPKLSSGAKFDKAFKTVSNG